MKTKKIKQLKAIHAKIGRAKWWDSLSIAYPLTTPNTTKLSPKQLLDSDVFVKYMIEDEVLSDVHKYANLKQLQQDIKYVEMIDWLKVAPEIKTPKQSGDTQLLVSLRQ
eukprot:634615_1